MPLVPPELQWFLSTLSNSPSGSDVFLSAVDRALKSKNARIEVTRVFRRHISDLGAIALWLKKQAIQHTGCPHTAEAYRVSLDALKAITSGEAASSAWRMGSKHGAKVGFSRTMEAAALYGYLTKLADPENPEKGFLFTSQCALNAVESLLKINRDDVRKYKCTSAIDDQSEASLAYWALCQNGLLAEADGYFDVEELKTKCNPELFKDSL